MVTSVRKHFGSAIKTLAHVRGTRLLHPKGIAFHGTIELRTPILGATGEFPAKIRFSRGIGLPAALPDFNGIAIKIPNFLGSGHDQDLLFTSSSGRPVGRRTLVPRRDMATWFSTALPYRHGKKLVVVAAHVDCGESGPDGTLDVVRFDDLMSPDTWQSLEVYVAYATSTGNWTSLANVKLTSVMSPAEERVLCFNPWNTSDEFRPAGIVNHLRRDVYHWSQEGRIGPADHDAPISLMLRH